MDAPSEGKGRTIFAAVLVFDASGRRLAGPNVIDMKNDTSRRGSRAKEDEQAFRIRRRPPCQTSPTNSRLAGNSSQPAPARRLSRPAATPPAFGTAPAPVRIASPFGVAKERQSASSRIEVSTCEKPRNSFSHNTIRKNPQHPPGDPFCTPEKNYVAYRTNPGLLSSRQAHRKKIRRSFVTLPEAVWVTRVCPLQNCRIGL